LSISICEEENLC
jgi:DNA ligase 1